MDLPGTTTRSRLARALAIGATATVLCAPVSASAAERPVAEGSRHAKVITHHGVGELRLGDRPGAVRAAGGRLLGQRQETCRGLVLPGRDRQRHRTDGYLAHGLGVVAFFSRGDMRTSEGIRQGSSLRAVKKAYPQLSGPGVGIRTAKVAPGVRYWFTFDDRHVTEFALVDDDQPCFN